MAGRFGRTVDPDLIREAREREAYFVQLDREDAARHRDWQRYGSGRQESASHALQNQLATNGAVTAQYEAERVRAEENAAKAARRVQAKRDAHRKLMAGGVIFLLLLGSGGGSTRDDGLFFWGFVVLPTCCFVAFCVLMFDILFVWVVYNNLLFLFG